MLYATHRCCTPHRCCPRRMDAVRRLWTLYATHRPCISPTGSVRGVPNLWTAYRICTRRTQAVSSPPSPARWPQASRDRLDPPRRSCVPGTLDGLKHHAGLTRNVPGTHADRLGLTRPSPLGDDVPGTFLRGTNPGRRVWLVPARGGCPRKRVACPRYAPPEWRSPRIVANKHPPSRSILQYPDPAATIRFGLSCLHQL